MRDERIEHAGRRLMSNIDPVQDRPGLVERRRVESGVLQGESGERLAVSTSPRLLSRMIEREKYVEACQARVFRLCVPCAAFSTE
jgi:hypothetical protein